MLLLIIIMLCLFFVDEEKWMDVFQSKDWARQNNASRLNKNLQIGSSEEGMSFDFELPKETNPLKSMLPIE